VGRGAPVRHRRATDQKLREVFDVSSFRLPAILVVATALLAWIPASHATTSFSISIHGGDFRGHGGPGRHFQGPWRHRYHAYPRYRAYRHFYHRPYWERRYSHRPYRYYEPPGPRCIYRYGYQYCR